MPQAVATFPSRTSKAFVVTLNACMGCILLLHPAVLDQRTIESDS